MVRKEYWDVRKSCAQRTSASGFGVPIPEIPLLRDTEKTGGSLGHPNPGPRVTKDESDGACVLSGRWANVRAMSVARARGAVRSLCQSDLDQAVTLEGPLARVDAETRERFLRVLDEQRRLVTEDEQVRSVAEDQGLAKKGARRHHRPTSLERVAIRRALELCHILKIEGRAYRRSFRARSV